MITTFNFNRLGLLLRRYFIENKNKEIMYWVILTLVFTLVHKSEVSILYIMGFIFAAKLFKSFAYTPGGMHFLLIPATQLEKLVSNILLSTVYYFTMIMITFSIGNIIGTNLLNLLFNQSNPVTWEFFNSANVQTFGPDFDPFQGNVFLKMILTFLTIQSVFMLGSIYFKRGAIGRTMLSLFALTIVFGLLEYFIFKGIFGEMYSLKNINSYTVMVDSSTTLTIIQNGILIFSCLLIPYLWIVTYFRLTEKQV